MPPFLGKKWTPVFFIYFLFNTQMLLDQFLGQMFFKLQPHIKHTFQVGGKQQKKKKVDVFLGSWNQKALRVLHALSLSPPPSQLPIHSFFHNWSALSPLLTGAKLLKTPLLKWSAHFTLPQWTRQCGLQILCWNVLRKEASSCMEWKAGEGKLCQNGRARVESQQALQALT